jgi:ribosomal protein L29
VDPHFPAKVFHQEAAGNAHGQGQGPLESWVAVIRPANVLFEVDGVTEAVARESLRLAATKLPIKTKFISRHRCGFAIEPEILVYEKTEMKDMTLVELAAKSRDLRQEMFNLRLQQASAQLEKPARLRTLRKDIARSKRASRNCAGKAA